MNDEYKGGMAPFSYKEILDDYLDNNLNEDHKTKSMIRIPVNNGYDGAVVYINPDLITVITEYDGKYLHIKLSDGSTYELPVSFEEFKRMI